MFNLKKGQLKIFIINLIIILIFSYIFIIKRNYEFIGYIGVIILALSLILISNKKINYPNFVLWGLTLWGLLHLAGGSVFISGTKLYEIVILNLIGEPYFVLKYDQFVHIVGFGVATLLAYYIIKPNLKTTKSWKSLSFIVILAGLGLGALNEIIEFLATVIVPETGVGGYINTSLDLVANFLGAILAMFLVYINERNN